MSDSTVKTCVLACTPDTSLGEIWVAVSARGLVMLEFGAREEILKLARARGWQCLGPEAAPPALCAQAQQWAQQVSEYLLGQRQVFSLPIDWTDLRPFQEEALRITYAIPYGETLTYHQVAEKLGKPQAARAVGRAEATNPMPLVIPCHRVVGSDGKLHGYGGAGGIPTKGWLLRMERGQG